MEQTTAWGRCSREARTGVLLPTHAGHPAWSRPLRGADARGRLARAYCFPPMRRKEPAYMGHPAWSRPLRGADARGRLARAYCFPPMRRKEPAWGTQLISHELLPTHSAERRGMDGARSYFSGTRQPTRAMRSAANCMETMKATQAGHLPMAQKMPGTTPAAVPPR